MQKNGEIRRSPPALRGRYVVRQNALGPGSRRGRGRDGWSGAPCGCPPCFLPHDSTRLSTPSGGHEGPHPSPHHSRLSRVLTTNLPMRATRFPIWGLRPQHLNCLFRISHSSVCPFPLHPIAERFPCMYQLPLFLFSNISAIASTTTAFSSMVL
jgi:hypothetical protein